MLEIAIEQIYSLFCSDWQLDMARSHIADPEILTGKPVIKGTRLALEFMIDLLANVWSQSKILQNYTGRLMMIFRPVFATQGP